METISVKKQILQTKLDNLLQNKKNHVLTVIDKIEDDVKNLNDAIVPFGPMSPMRFTANGTFNAIMENEKYVVHSNALSQLSYLFGIPGSYTSSLLHTEWGRELLRDIFSEHNDNSGRKRMLVRSVGKEIRGVLSDKYRRLDSRFIYEKFISKAIERGAEVVDANYDKTKQYITVVFPKVFEISTENNGTIYSAFGARISNGDFGNSALNLNAFQMNCICDNGLVAESMLSAKHLGKRLSSDLQLSEHTYRLDTKTMASAVGDITNQLLSEKTMIDMASKIKRASVDIIDMDNAIKHLPKEIYKHEAESIRKVLQNGDENLGIYGKPTVWKLSQAITAVGNEITGTRKHELDEIAGKLLKL
jgi:hypothetical protein